MFNKWLKYSYAAQKNQRHHVRWILIWLASFFVLYTLVTVFFFSMRVLENETMQPGLHAGDRFIFSSYKFHGLLSDTAPLNRELPFHRGNVVLVDMALREDRRGFSPILDMLIRFFTLQRLSLFDREEHFYIKRVLGLPGDEISMTNFVLRIKPAGEAYGLTEFELSERPYDVTIPQVPALWDESIPFSGNMETLVLGENDCFVLSDDRSNTNDSRTWGPVPVDLIAGKALFRYWPLTHLGRP
ncbi:MAG: signal peptidase I [Treponema sp.]|jgi:signal peptidase I|nr:signal peptidase I [Treponema sp.]